MVRVAIAGGSGCLGRVIARAIVSTGKHDVFILSRKPKNMFQNLPAVISVVIDYSNVSQIAELLRGRNIELVISTIGIVSEDSHRSQLALIDGASQSRSVRRFAPSEFFLDYVESKRLGYPFSVPGSSYKVSQYKIEALKRLKATGMEYTRFITGFLMDFYGCPASTSPSIPMAIVLDIEHCEAAIPIDGNTHFTMTHSETIANFVAKSIDMPSWPKRLWIIGDTMTWNEALSIAENVRGKKFKTENQSLYDLKKGFITELSGNKSRYSRIPRESVDALLCVWNIGFIQGFFDLEAQKGNERPMNEMFPEVLVLGFEKFLRRCWP